MSNPFSRRALAVLATVVFLTVSIAAVAHGHPVAKSDDGSHCAMCMVAHNVTHALGTSIITLDFIAGQTAFLVHPESFLAVFVQLLLNQDRAPPRLWPLRV